jgi:hypothetical protein
MRRHSICRGYRRTWVMGKAKVLAGLVPLGFGFLLALACSTNGGQGLDPNPDAPSAPAGAVSVTHGSPSASVPPHGSLQPPQTKVTPPPQPRPVLIDIDGGAYD